MASAQLRSPAPNAVTVKQYRVTFCRPENAIPVSSEERADQLRQVMSKCVNVSTRYIPVEVSICPGECEKFCIAFTTDPSHALADKLIRDQVKLLRPDQIKQFIGLETGIWPRFLGIEEIPTAGTP